jgi:hypothetical protein
MKMTPESKAIDKIYKRRNRYEMPDWQRGGNLWDQSKKQALIDSMLRGWRLPKFYFIKTAPEQFLVEDGQQRLLAIYDFFDDELTLSTETAKKFGGKYYSKLPQAVAEALDDFEIVYDVIEEATDEDLKEFFQRLQAGLPLTSSEKLNALHGKLRDFVRTISRHSFFKDTIAIANTRYSHFDIAAKVVCVEIEGLQTGLRFDDIKSVFEGNASFSTSSAVAKRIQHALTFLQSAFKGHGSSLRTRTIVQSLITLSCKLIETGRAKGHESELRTFFEKFSLELGRQIELGAAATDSDYLLFQRSVNANVKGGAKTRHEILLRKLFAMAPKIASIFDPSVIAESGASARISELGESISLLVVHVNRKYAANAGTDLFKATNKTTQALINIGKPVSDLEGFKTLADNLYFLFRESLGARLSDRIPASFVDVNSIRTDLRHDIDHGEDKKIRAKRRKLGNAFAKYSGEKVPETMDPIKFSMVQANLLGALEGDLRVLLAGY